MFKEEYPKNSFSYDFVITSFLFNEDDINSKFLDNLNLSADSPKLKNNNIAKIRWEIHANVF